jgi:hypothetical protein
VLTLVNPICCYLNIKKKYHRGILNYVFTGHLSLFLPEKSTGSTPTRFIFFPLEKNRQLLNIFLCSRKN